MRLPRRTTGNPISRWFCQKHPHEFLTIEKRKGAVTRKMCRACNCKTRDSFENNLAAMMMSVRLAQGLSDAS